MDTPPILSQGAARWINQTIETRGISVNQLSTATGIPRITLRRRLAGSDDFKLNELSRIARHLGVKASEITAAAEESAA